MKVDALVVSGFDDLSNLLSKNERFVFYVQSANAEVDDLRRFFRALNQFSRTVGGHGYIFNLLEEDPLNPDRALQQIEAVPMPAGTSNN